VRFVVKLVCLVLASVLLLAGLVPLGALIANQLVHAAALVADSSPAQLPPAAQRSIVYAADGSVLAVLHADDNRQPVPLDEVAPVAVNAIIDTEDARFWHHGAVDGRGILRALLTNARARRAREGGSTIAQQLVKQTLLKPDRNIGRKLKEMVLADRVERQLGKRGVLERYLNTVYFGEGAYGIQAAAENYFGLSAGQLDVAQSALLAGLIQEPNRYDPMRHPGAARLRRDTVLGLMARHYHLSPADAADVRSEPLPTALASNRPPQGDDYITATLKKELLTDPRLGHTAGDRYRAVFAGGLQIHTTIDSTLQHEAQAAIAGGLPAGYNLAASLVSVDPVTGAIRALANSGAFGTLQFNPAIQGGRQAGSAFKPFTLITALEAGFSPNDMIDGTTPCSVPNPQGTPDPWTPGNFEGERFGWLTVTDATAYSVNCAYARLATLVGPRAIADTAHAMGITTRLKVVPSITLGVNPVNPLEMANAYATLAADGVYRPAHLIDNITGPDGKVVMPRSNPGTQVVPPQIAREGVQVLQQVVLKGTGVAAAVPGHMVAGKTGTAEDYHDAWFVGFAPQLATAVWMGNVNGELSMRNINGINVVGGSYPARMWSAFMTQALAPLPDVPFPPLDPNTIPPPVTLADGAGHR
jgi:penicillin-binding protein 1A